MSVVGPIVGDLGGVAGTSVSTPAGGSGDDFAINDLLFKVAPTDTNQYQRATAQFRKDQFDSGQQAGDQSLTGWWTRGEFSFHKGAGITYYEVSQGDTIVNRYLDSEGLDPFDPGKVTCQRSWSSATSTGTLHSVQTIGAYVLALDGTALKYSSGFALGSTYAPAGGATVRAFTVSATLAYALLSNGKIASLNPATGTETTLYTGLTTTALGIWYVKGRLVVQDSNGKWYQLAASPTAPPVAVASTDVIFTAADWSSSSTITDSPGPILVGNANRIFALTLDSTGAIPTLSAPVQVAELPPGETISSLAFHLGFVVIWTSAGVRVGVVSDSNAVTYGPVLIEHTTPVSAFYDTTIARYGTRVAVALEGRIYEIDLSQQVGSGLEFAYAGRGTPLDSGSNCGVTTSQYTTLVAWNQTGLYHSDPTASYLAGSLTTGYHRFNTLEPKRFDSVRVHCDGASGTVEVLQVASDGSELSLYVMDVSLTHVEQIPFRFTTGQEVAGLKFVLTPSPGAPTVTPVLLGYQIRALPEPQRQRMIRVPLMLKDHERRQPARMTGTKDSAYSRLRALEDLEDSSAIVTFRDYRTGETGSAYIESVEFTNSTPPSANSSGFGGTVFLTIRKLI